MSTRVAADFETRLEVGRVKIRAGHPCYCWNPYRHLEHEFYYAYLDRRGNQVAGSYRCKGDGDMARQLLLEELVSDSGHPQVPNEGPSEKGPVGP